MKNTPSFIGFYILARTGFEAEIANECYELTTQSNLPGYVQAQPGQAYACFHSSTPFTQFPKELHPQHWIFARQVVPMLAEFTQLTPNDRLSPILALLAKQAVSGIIAETPDTNEGKSLNALAKGLTNAARQQLKQRQQYRENNPQLPRLHLLILAGDHIIVGLSYLGESSQHVGGIQHLKLPKNAPSRAILKLEEAALTLLSAPEKNQWLRSGMSAVDLGAAPGGWTWWLTQQGLNVIAIDNANMAQNVMQTGLVEHIRADGFNWQPRYPVHWVCCDMVEQPQRVVMRLRDWLVHGWAQAALFNLKLPMKKRYAMVHSCLEQLTPLQPTHDIRAKQLYHDREEITVIVLPKTTQPS